MSNRKEVFTVCPRGEGKKDFWLRIGTAFENRDGSWSIVLDALPTSGKLIVREPREQQDTRDDPPPRRSAPRESYPKDDGEIPF
jgi:hypothetical protein